jgi:nucleoside-diphosphate-sugar epimerase
MKILITGANGVVGKILHMQLAPWHSVRALQGRADLDLMSRAATDKFFTANQFDVVIHCAVAGADNVLSTAPSITHTNLVMWHNLKANYRSFNRLINIASGCELGTGPDRLETELTQQLPLLPYGLSKNIIARDVIQTAGWYNLRLFGLIAQTRLFWKLQEAVVEGKTKFDIYDDKYMDYIHEDDLAKIVQAYAESKITLLNDVNMVYETKYRVSEVLARYIDDMGFDIELNILNTLDDNAGYTGNGSRLAQLGIL